MKWWLLGIFLDRPRGRGCFQKTTDCPVLANVMITSYQGFHFSLKLQHFGQHVATANKNILNGKVMMRIEATKAEFTPTVPTFLSPIDLLAVHVTEVYTVGLNADETSRSSCCFMC